MFYSIFVFIVVLLVLVMIHELGHFLAAKISKMRVEEFAFGFPPKVFSKKVGETVYAVNFLPIGGYVKITGESFEESEREKLKKDKMAFQNRPKILQLFVLFAGVFMNMVLAFVIFSFLNTREQLLPNSNNYESYIQNPKMYISGVMPNSPAAKAGIVEGSEIVKVYADGEEAILNSESNIIDLVKKHYEGGVTIEYKEKGGKIMSAKLVPEQSADKTKRIVGLALVYGDYVRFGGVDIFKYGLIDTYKYTKMTVAGVVQVFKNLLLGQGLSDSVSGPIGIAKMVGEASKTGIDNVLFITAILSVNLAIFNLLPVPALDGGRIIFVLYEAIMRRNINYKFQYYANSIGFFLLMILMIFTIYKDLMK